MGFLGSSFSLQYLEIWTLLHDKHEGLHRNYTLVVNVNDFSAQNVVSIFMYAIAKYTWLHTYYVRLLHTNYQLNECAYDHTIFWFLLDNILISSFLYIKGLFSLNSVYPEVTTRHPLNIPFSPLLLKIIFFFSQKVSSLMRCKLDMFVCACRCSWEVKKLSNRPIVQNVDSSPMEVSGR